MANDIRNDRFTTLAGEMKLVDADNVVKGGEFKITKANEEKMLAFGWANIAIRKDGTQIEDWQKDIVDPEELEKAVYKYVELHRDGGEMHVRGGSAVMIESVVFTKEKMKAMGIPEGTVPEGWWIGFKVTDPEVWAAVKAGKYRMFSIEGEAIRQEVTKRKPGPSKTFAEIVSGSIK